MDVGYKNYLKKDWTKRLINLSYKNNGDNIKYSYKSFYEKDKLDTIEVKIIKLRDEIISQVDLDKLENIKKSSRKSFVLDYFYTYIKVILDELVKGNVVRLGLLLGLSMNTNEKTRLKKSTGKMVSYKTLRIYVHISKPFYLKTQIFYYSHGSKYFRRNISDLRKNVKYERYPKNFL